MADADRRIELRPDDPDGYAARAELYRALSQHRPALADLERLLELDPERSWAYSFRSLIYKDLGQRQQAEAAFQQATEVEARRAAAQKAEQERRAEADTPRAKDVISLI